MTLLGRLLECERVGTDLLSGPRAAAAVELVLGAARRLDIHALAAASPAAERLVGAAVYVAGGTLRVWSPNEGGDVLVIDVATASDLAVRRAVSHLRPVAGRVRAMILAEASLRASAVAEVVSMEALLRSA